MQRARITQAYGDYQRAEIAYRRALKIDPANAAAMTGLAWVHDGRHQFEQSIFWARRAVDIDPRQTDAYGLWGDALVEMGDYEAAFKKVQRMLDLRPDLASYSRGAHLLFLSGETQAALSLMEKALKAGGPYAENIAWCRAKLALMLKNLGEYAKAEALLTVALKQAPHNYRLLAAMAEVQTAMKKYKTAIAGYEAANTLVPQPANITALGDLYLLKGAHREAKRLFAWAEAIWRLRSVVGRQPDIQRARFYAGHDRNLSQALAEAKKIYRTRKNITVADTLSWCYYKNGKIYQARRMIQQALRLNTPQAQISYHAGMIYARLGKRTLARKYLQSALALDPHFHPLDAARAAQKLSQLEKGG